MRNKKLKLRMKSNKDHEIDPDAAAGAAVTPFAAACDATIAPAVAERKAAQQ